MWLEICLYLLYGDKSAIFSASSTQTKRKIHQRQTHYFFSVLYRISAFDFKIITYITQQPLYWIALVLHVNQTRFPSNYHYLLILTSKSVQFVLHQVKNKWMISYIACKALKMKTKNSCNIQSGFTMYRVGLRLLL